MPGPYYGRDFRDMYGRDFRNRDIWGDMQAGHRHTGRDEWAFTHSARTDYGYGGYGYKGDPGLGAEYRSGRGEQRTARQRGRSGGTRRGRNRGGSRVDYGYGVPVRGMYSYSLDYGNTGGIDVDSNHGSIPGYPTANEARPAPRYETRHWATEEPAFERRYGGYGPEFGEAGGGTFAGRSRGDWARGPRGGPSGRGPQPFDPEQRSPFFRSRGPRGRWGRYGGRVAPGE